jgi:hypothetical protein
MNRQKYGKSPDRKKNKQIESLQEERVMKKGSVKA